MLRGDLRGKCLGIGLAVGLMIFFGLLLSIRIDDFTYVLAHERDIFRSFGDLWTDNLLRGPEVKPGDRIWGGGYYLLLHAASFFGTDWLRASARFAVVLHAGLLTIVTLHAKRRGWHGAYLWCAPLLLLLSTTLAENLAHLWNPTFLPLFLALSLAAGYEASTTKGRAALAWGTISTIAALFCTQIHASAWVLVLAFPLAAAHHRWRAAGGRGGIWILTGLVCALAASALIFPEATRTRLASLEILRHNLFTYIEPLRSAPSYRWSLAARNLVDVAALVLLALAFRPSRGTHPTLYSRWLSWALALAALPALYALLWYFPSPHNFKHRYCLAFVLIATFRALDRRAEAPANGFAALAILSGGALWLLIRWGAPAPLQPTIAQALLWLLGGTTFLALATCRSGDLRGRLWLGLTLLGAATGLWSYQSAASPLFFSRPVGSFLKLSQGRDISRFIKQQTGWSWTELSRRLFLVGLQSNAAFTYFYENVASEPSGPPTPQNDRRLAFVLAWPAEVTGPTPTSECRPDFLQLLGESHEWLAGLLARGEIVPKACLVTARHAGVALLELTGQEPSFAAVSNYGYSAFETFPHWDCSGPGLDRKGRECLTGWWHRSPETPGTLWIGIEGKGLGDREANRYLRWHALDLEYEVSCGGRVAAAPLVPRTKRTERGADTLFPSRWSMMMDHQILAPTSWRVPDPCGSSDPSVRLRWRASVQYGANGESEGPAGSLSLRKLVHEPVGL